MLAQTEQAGCGPSMVRISRPIPAHAVTGPRSKPRPSPAHEGRRANGSGPGTDRPRRFLRPVRSQSAGAGRFSGSAGKRPARRMGPLRADSGGFLVTLLPAKESRTAGFVIAPQGAERFPTDGKKGDKRPFSAVSGKKNIRPGGFKAENLPQRAAPFRLPFILPHPAV